MKAAKLAEPQGRQKMKTKDYEDLLDQKLASTTARLDLSERAIKGIIGKVKSSA